MLYLLGLRKNAHFGAHHFGLSLGLQSMKLSNLTTSHPND